MRCAGRVEPGSGAGPIGQLAGVWPRERTFVVGVVGSARRESRLAGVVGGPATATLTGFRRGPVGTTGASPAAAGSRNNETRPAVKTARIDKRPARDQGMAENCTVLSHQGGYGHLRS